MKTIRILFALVTWWLAMGAGPVSAQRVPNQFGGQDRADAAARLIVLAVQQGIGSLPPSSGQSFTFEYDPEVETFVRGRRLGPTALRSTDPVGRGQLVMRLATSYFALDETFGPIVYRIQPVEIPGPAGLAKFGLQSEAHVGVLNLSAAYGVSQHLDVSLSVPIVVVDASASQSFTTVSADRDAPPDEALVVGAPTLEDLNAQLATGDLVFRRERFSEQGFRFNEGTHAGLGRAGLGVKGVLYEGPRLRAVFNPELFFPSPNEDELAGSETFALLPRLIASLKVTEALRLHGDVGYDYDFDRAELRRFVSSVGTSISVGRATLDTGIASSLYDVPVRWTPSVTGGAAPDGTPLVIHASEDNKLGDSFVDFIAGLKLRIRRNVVLAAALSVPLSDDGLRPDALGTLATEITF